MEPLESTSIWMIQTGIARLLSNFPDLSFAQVDIDRYNRVLIEETEYIRDFLVLHYKATERDDTPFWNYCRNMSIPERLSEKMRVYLNNGRTFREHDELFNDTSWFAVLAGQCGKPRSYDPVADLFSIDETRKRLDQIRTAVANSADYMPDHRAFIEQNCAA
jgi:tryptophan halogenase